MPMRQIGGFRSAALNPLATRATAVATNIVQTQGSFDPATVGQALAAGQWATDPYGNQNIALLQSDNAVNAAFNGTIVDSSANNATSTISQNVSFNKFNLAATSPFTYHPQSFLNVSAVTYSSIGITLTDSSTACIEGWMYLYAYPGSATTPKALLCYANTSTGLAWTVGVTNGGYATVYWNDGTLRQAIGSQYIALNRWVFVQFNFSGGAITMGVDGVQDSYVTGTTSLTTPTGTFTYTTGAERNNAANFNVFDLRVSNTTRAFIKPTEPLPADGNTTLSVFETGLLVDYSSTNATLTQSATLPSASPGFAPLGRKYGPGTTGCFYMSGGTALSIPSNAVLDVGANNFTLELFVHPLSATLAGGLIGRRATTAAFAGVNLVAASNAITATATVNGTTYGVTIASAASAIKPFQWNHIAFSRSGNTWTLYINGAASGTPVTLAGTVPAGSAVFTTGASSAAFSDYISNCLISNVRLVVGATTAYSTVASIPTVPLDLTATTANTKLLYSCAATGVVNNSQGGVITSSGAAGAAVSLTTTNARYGSGSVSYSGTTMSMYSIMPNAQQDTAQLWAGDFTIEGWAWMNQAQYGTAQTLVSFGATTTTGFSLNITSTANLSFTSTGTTITASAGLFRPRVWTHFAVVRSGISTNNLAMYLNGQLVGRGTSSVVFNSVSTVGMYIGASQTNATLFSGLLEDVRITKGVARYVRGFVPPPFGLGRQQ
jgi:hypothetical protein